MKAIILAAGKGRRISELVDDFPKSMLKINNKSIIHNQIEACKKVGIKKFVFVLGYKKSILENHILEKLPSEEVSIVLNPEFASTNTLYSLWLAKDFFDEDFIYFNADVMFQTDLLKKLQGEIDNSTLLVDFKHCQQEEVKVILDEQKYIKKIGKKLEMAKCAGEFIGIARFKYKDLSEFLKFLEMGVKAGQKNNYFEYAVNKLAKKKKLKAVATGDFDCIEIDFPEDYQKAVKNFQ